MAEIPPADDVAELDEQRVAACPHVRPSAEVESLHRGIHKVQGLEVSHETLEVAMPVRDADHAAADTLGKQFVRGACAGPAERFAHARRMKAAFAGCIASRIKACRLFRRLPQT
eukprot:CAMPEP_0198593478 /NCGR_PEP_ID=MMETSP1462-20131121/139445_1 /TAXON_ID=1333877 /ORGANISM="Brandtodinium nutriculum, Strain RCC3387" /LENGTH=113 /DNA_ID=CAMNT_0044325077 /DNA_START=324 /DNA_END=662 /DNA_ORIENTATION=+